MVYLPFPSRLAVLLASLLLSIVSAAAALSPVSLRCESQVNPLGVDAGQPSLSWLLQSSQRGEAPSAYQVLVASSVANLNANTGDLWDSGKVVSGENAHISYSGSALASFKQIFWKVRVWNQADAASAWSASATWTMGVLNPSDWTAQWITPSTAATNVGSTLLRKNFTVASGLTRAVVFVSGLGQCEMTVNGAKASSDFLSPGWTMYNKTVLYNSYDITALLSAGTNAVGLNLGNGMYNIPTNSGRYTKITQSFGPRKAIAQIRLEYANGTVQTVATDGTWKWSAGPITFNTIYGGEDYDARQEQPGWDLPTFNDASWTAASTTTGPGGVLRGASFSAPPIRTQETLNIVTPALNGTAAKVVYDLGQNAAQTPTITVHGSAGATVTITPSELGTGGVNGSISPIVSPCYLTYTLKGSTAGVPETFTPRFFYTGYRYLQVQLSAGATLDGLTSAVVQSNADATGTFTCSNSLFTNIRTLVRWAQRSNEVSIFTDCPTREKLGWLEQNYLNGPSLRYEFDVSGLFSATMQAMADSQTGSGVIPTTAPAYLGSSGDFGDTPEWGSNFILSAWQQYEFTGDVRLLSQYYGAMKAYLAYLGTRSNGYIVNYGLGDWYDLGPNGLGYAQLTPIALTATATYYRDTWTLAQIAQVLGNTTDATTYNTLAGNIRTAFNNSFYNASTGTYGTGSQTSNSMPLELGIVDSANLTKVGAAFVQSIRRNQNAMTSGDIGMSYMLPALTDIGRPDVGFDMHTRTSSPGYGYILSRGATALTEGWDGSNSQNHFMLGHITEWFYRHLAGIQPDITGAGFKKIIIRPRIVGNLTSASATYTSVRGPITSNWTLSGGQLTLNVAVPPGSTATVYVPTLGTPTSSLLVQESGTTIWQNGAATGSISNVTYDHTETGNQLQTAAVWKVGSGSYSFTAQLMPIPAGLTATPGFGQVTLSWNPVANATGYTVKRSATSGGPYAPVAANLTGTTFTDTAVTNGVTYYYVVSAQTSAGTSGDAFEISATPVISGNLGFELPGISTYQYNPAGASWSFTAQSGNIGSGISANGTGFTSSNAKAPEGVQVAFLQGTSTIAQSFLMTPGTAYGITFSAAQRGSYNSTGETWDLRRDGTTLASYAPAQSATSYVDYTAAFVATAASHTLAFVGTNTKGGDNTIFLDNVRLVALGTIIGTSGSFNNNATATSAAVFDGNFNTAFDSAEGSGAWVGLDLGAPRQVTAVRYAPRANYAARMVDGKFQGSNTADFSSGVVDLFTVTVAPAYSVLTSQTITNPNGFRYVRYLSPNNANCNIAEMGFTTVAVIPAAPANVTATAGDSKISLAWSLVDGASTYSVRSATASGGPYTLVASGLSTPAFLNTGLGDGTTRFYVVTATNEAGESANSNETSATTYTAAMKWRLTNFGTLSATGNAADDADPDGDGLSNAQEYAAGTDPNDSRSSLKISKLEPGQTGWLISFPTVSGKTYRLESSSTLQSGSWINVKDNIAGTGGIVQIPDSTSNASSRLFYRAVLLP